MSLHLQNQQSSVPLACCFSRDHDGGFQIRPRPKYTTIINVAIRAAYYPGFSLLVFVAALSSAAAFSLSPLSLTQQKSRLSTSPWVSKQLDATRHPDIAPLTSSQPRSCFKLASATSVTDRQSMTLSLETTMFLALSLPEQQGMISVSPFSFSRPLIRVRVADMHLTPQDLEKSKRYRDRGALGFKIEGEDTESGVKSPYYSLSLRASAQSGSGNVDFPPATPWKHMGEEVDDVDTVSSWTSLSSWSKQGSGRGRSSQYQNVWKNRLLSPLTVASPEPTTRQGGSSVSLTSSLPWIPTASQIEQLSVVQLKLALSDRDLPRTGSKAEMQRRLLVWSGKQRDQLGGRALPFDLCKSYGVGKDMVPPSRRFYSPEQKEEEEEYKPLPSQKQDNDSNLAPGEGQNDPDAAWINNGEWGSDSYSDKKYQGKLTANSLAEWSRTVDLQPLFSRREAIHREKQQGKNPPPNHRHNGAVKGNSKMVEQQTDDASIMSKEEYISVLKKVFAESSSSGYSNHEVKQIYKAAKEADQMGDRALSKRILTELKEVTPHDMRIYRRLSRMEKEEGNIAQARAILQEGLRLDPENAFLWLGLGPLATSNHEAKNCYRKAMQCDPSFPMAYHALGTLEHSQGLIASAMKTLKEGLDYCPTNHRLHHALGDLYRDAKLLGMAEKCYLKALQLGPEVSHGFVYNALAYVAYEDGKVAQCRSWLQKATSLNDGRHANSWVALAQMEEAEGNIEAARAVCMAGIAKYERGLLKRAFKSQKAPPLTAVSSFDVPQSRLSTTASELRNRLMTRVPVYRSGDRFFNVYRNWARLEERYGTIESVAEVYQRAFLAFPTNWKLTIDWAHYYQKLNMPERAGQLFAMACSQSAGQEGEPYRFHAEYEMLARGNYEKAQKILFQGAVALSQTARAGKCTGMAELYYVWAVCEWHLDNLARAETLFDQALRLTIPGDEGSSLRSLIWFAMAKLQMYQGKPVLAQHCIGLCLKEKSIPNSSRVWDLWAAVAEDMQNDKLCEQCRELAGKAREKEEGAETQKQLDLLSPTSAGTGLGGDMNHLMRRDPWYFKIFGSTTSTNFHKQRSTSYHAIRLPLLPWENDDD